MSDSSPFEVLARHRKWYTDNADWNCLWYFWLKIVQIVCAAAIPVAAVASGGNAQRWVSGGLGALVGVIEGSLQLWQFHANWLRYRATSEALKREAYLHSAQIDVYAAASNPDAVYLSRCDAIVGREHEQWLHSQEHPPEHSTGSARNTGRQ